MIVETIPIYDVDIELTYEDESTENFTLEAPNADNPFEIEFRRVNILDPYRDGNYTLQKGFEKYQMIARFEYQSHRMNLFKLLAAESIKLKIPPTFSDNPADNYQQFIVFLANEQVIRNWLGGLPLGSSKGTSLNHVNPMPGGEITLEFQGVTPFTEAEILGNDPNPDDDQNDRIKWDQDTQNEGVLYQLDGYSELSSGWSAGGGSVAIASSTASDRVFDVPDGTKLFMRLTSYSARIVSNSWSGVADPELFIRLFNNQQDFYTDEVDIVESVSCAEPVPAQLLGAMGNYVELTTQQGGQFDPKLILSRKDMPTFSESCEQDPYEFTMLVRFIGLSDSDVNVDQSDPELTVTLIQDYTG